MAETRETLPEAPEKWRCECCDWIGGDYLTAPNPFDPADKITGCPSCKAVDSMRSACQADGCTRPGTSGTPGWLGYRYVWTCYEHSPHATTSPASRSAS